MTKIVDEIIHVVPVCYYLRYILTKWTEWIVSEGRRKIHDH